LFIIIKVRMFQYGTKCISKSPFLNLY
jgi:hypothetical protein